MVVQPSRCLWIVALAMMCGGCYVEHFDYYQTDRKGSFECHVMKGVGSVEHGGDSIVVYPGAVLSVRKIYETFHTAEFWVRVPVGNAMRVRMRSTDFGDSVGAGIAVTLGRTASTVQVAQNLPRSIAPRLDSGMTHVSLFSEAKEFMIIVGCDTVYQGKTDLPATDVLVFESADSSEVHIRGLSSDNLRESKSDVRFRELAAKKSKHR